MTTLTLPRKLIRPVGSHPARRSALLGLVAGLILGMLLLVSAAFAIGASTGSAVLRGVTVGGVDLTGLERAAAEERLARELPALDVGQAIVRVGETEQAVAFADIGRGYRTDAMLDAALAVGRSGNPLADGIARLRSLVHPAALPVVVHPYDPAALAGAAADISRQASIAAVEASVVRSGDTFTVREGRDGRGLSAQAVADALGAAVATADPSDVLIELEATRVAPAVDTAAAERAAAAANAMSVDLELSIQGAGGEDPLSIAADTIAAAISFGRLGADPYAVRLDDGDLLAAIEALATTVDRDPVNARIEVAAGGGLGGVVPAQEGRKVDVAATSADLRTALEQRAAGTSVGSMAMTVAATEPSLTTSEVERIRPQMQMISSWTTYYVPGEGNGFGANINIGAFDIDGRNLAPGEWFSFWGSIGPVTEERGYSYGGAIINGRSTQGVAIGGGICSTSTTIFNAALRAGLEMGVRANHYYYIDRYPDGLDATVSIIDGWTQDMTFRNDTQHPIVIRGFGGNGSVTFQIWSVPLGRTVVITDPITSNHGRATDTTVVDTSMAPGTSRRVEYPHDGHDVSRSRFVYDADGNLLHQNYYFSSYATVTGIVAVGPTAAAPPSDDESQGDTAGDGVVGDP